MDEILGVLPLKNMVLFPGVLLGVNVTREQSKQMVLDAQRENKLLAVCCQKKKEINDPTPDDLYTLGTCARVIRTSKNKNGSLNIVLEGEERIEIQSFIQDPSELSKNSEQSGYSELPKNSEQSRYSENSEKSENSEISDKSKNTENSEKRPLFARVVPHPEVLPDNNDQAFLQNVFTLREQAMRVMQQSEGFSVEAGMAIRNINNAPTLVNYLCVNFGFSIADKQQLLAIETLKERTEELLKRFQKEVEMLDMKAEIQNKTNQEISKNQREYYLQHQLETIQKELGDTGEQIAGEMKKRAAEKKWNEETKKRFEEELKKLQRMGTHSPEYAMQQNYLETLLDLPWNEYSTDNFDLQHAQQVLEEDHFGMEKVKERIVEYLAVQKQKQSLTRQQNFNLKSPILCLYGPPGVGKTSLGKSIARALGRKYARISLGGLHDEAEIRGHRRTYIGAMPGRVIENLRKCKTSNPVFVLDEIDKIGADYKGDPTSALLEVLDPEQNSTFHDNYIDIDYDLSQVLFIATANSLETIPRPLLDRMELIEMTGYLMEEKEAIVERHILPKQLAEHALTDQQMRLNKEAIDYLIEHYTRESGVRNLERQVAALCRKVITKIAFEQPYDIDLTPSDIETYLGKPRYTRDMYENNDYVGVVTGLAWTQVGGEILFIESSLSPSKQPTLTLTGNLGDVMKESATIALAYIKSHADDWHIARKDIETQAVHIHVPEGAIPKDGPSAGITMTTALVSAFTRRKVRPRIAMTGEMTLRGKVLPIGGVKEKILAAKRAGITDLILCKDNQKDVAEIPEQYLSGLTFHYVSDIHEVIDYALL